MTLLFGSNVKMEGTIEFYKPEDVTHVPHDIQPALSFDDIIWPGLEIDLDLV